MFRGDCGKCLISFVDAFSTAINRHNAHSKDLFAFR